MNELRRWSFLVLGVVALLGVGCGGDDDDDASIPLEDLPDQVADVYCGAIVPCLGALQDLFLNGSDCHETFAAQFADQELPRWQAAIEAGTLVYHGDKAQACLDAFAAAGCDIPSTRTPPACEAALEGQVALGGECNATLECAGSAYCKFDAACPGACTALEAAGGACDGDGDCADGLACRGSTCEAPAAEGDSCGGPDGPECTLGLICLGADADTTGVCQPIEEVLVGGDGDDCDPLGGGPLCQDGLSCVLDSLTPGTLQPIWKCAGSVGSGEACKAGFPDQCPDAEMCDADPQAGDIEGTCVSLPDAGEPCAPALLGAGCAPGLSCVEDTCTELARIGGACTVDDGCYSGTCDGDTCAAPPECAYEG